MMSGTTLLDCCLTLKTPITTAADDISFQTSLDVSCESSAKQQTIHMKRQDLFSLKKKTIKCRLLQILPGALRVKLCMLWLVNESTYICFYHSGVSG